MFIPVGLGSWPRVVPWSITLIVGVCVVWSVRFFPTVKNFDKVIESQAEALVPLKKDVMRQSCLTKFDFEFCSSMAPYLTSTESESSSKDEVMPAGSVHENVSKQSTIIEMVRAELSEVDKIKTFLKMFEGPYSEWSAEAKATKAYPVYVTQVAQGTAALEQFAKQEGFLSRKTFDGLRLLRATFVHNDWIHLLSNLALLIIFGWAVEQKVGFRATLAAFLVGSVVGLTIETLTGDSVVFGASAGVMSILGAFFILFLRTKMKFIFSMLVYYRSFYFPVAWTLPIFYFAQDFVLDDDVSGVAHLAHLGGLLFGMGAAFFYQRRFPLPAPFLFRQEVEAYNRMKQASTLEAMWPDLEEGLSWNVQNKVLVDAFLELAPMSQFKPDRKQQKKMTGWMEFHLHRIQEKDPLESTSLYLSLLRKTVDLSPLLSSFSWQNILHLADHSTRSERYELALILYDIALPKVSSQATREAVMNTCQAIRAATSKESLIFESSVKTIGE